ncbi:MAG: hypothetical protein LM514_04420 [Streptococcus sp.]|nr:hypothetical protein [Streptococcus sp.]
MYKSPAVAAGRPIIAEVVRERATSESKRGRMGQISKIGIVYNTMNINNFHAGMALGIAAPQARINYSSIVEMQQG